MHFRRSTVLGIVILFAAAAAHARSTGRVSGRVLDQTGAVLPGVTIDLLVNSREHTTTTDAAGVYRFDAHLVLEAFNIFDAEVSDIDDFYPSRLPSEPAAASTTSISPGSAAFGPHRS